MRFRDVLREREWWLLALLVLAVFHRPLSGETFFFRDLYQLFYPKKELLVNALAAGQVPWWDPLAHGGQPYLASPSNFSFYPSTLLFFVLPLAVAFTVNIVAHYVFCAFAAYWLARVARLTPRAAFVAGAVYSLAGATLSAANLLPLLLALGWIPIVIGLAHRWLETSRGGYVACAGVAAAFPLLAGAAEVTAMLFVTLAVWMATTPARGKAPVRARALACGAIAVVAVALSSIQTVPAARMVRSSSRAAARSYEAFSQWSVSPRRLPELVVPGFFGRTDALDDRDYWGRYVEDEGFPYLLSIYAGVVTLLLGTAAVVQRRDEVSDIPARPLAWLTAAALVLAMGRFLPFFPLIYRLPLVAMFRFPVKAMLLATLPLALLAARGLDRIATDAQLARRVALAAAGFAVAAAMLTIAIRSGGGLAAALTSVVFREALDAPRLTALSSTLLHTAVVAGAGALLFLAARRFPMAANAIAALAAIDLAFAGAGVNAYAPHALFDEPAAARMVRGIAGDGRFYRTPDPESIVLSAPTNDVFWLARWKIETLSGYNAAAFGIPVVYHVDYDGLAPRAVMDLTRLTDAAPWPVRVSLLRLAGVTAVMTFGDVREPGAVVIAKTPTGNGPLSLVRIDDAPRARFVSRVESFDDRSATLHRLLSPLPADTIVLTALPRPPKDCGSAPVRILGRAINRVAYLTDAPCAGYVYFAEPFYPGWRVTVDGAPQRLIVANHAFSAVAVSPGRHRIERAY